MIWGYVAALVVVALAPLFLFARRGGSLRGRQDSAMALHRAQLTELDRDLAEGRLLPEEHAGARLEVQRRLLADSELADGAARKSGALPVLAAALLVPACAIGMYLFVSGGFPEFPPKDADIRPINNEQAAREAQDDVMVAQLRARLALIPEGSQKWVEGYGLLGKVEYSRGHLTAAADAWKIILAQKYDPGLAADVGEVLSEASGKVTPEALAYFKRSLAESPAGSPWIALVKKRMGTAAPK